MLDKQIQKSCLALPGTTEEILWGDNRVFKVVGKMFLVMGLETDSRYTFKCPLEQFYELTEMPGVIPAPYLARAHWVQVYPSECIFDFEQIESLIHQSYYLVVAKLPQKKQKSLKKQSK